MKQNTEELDYRSMNEVELKYELIKLEKKILDKHVDLIPRIASLMKGTSFCLKEDGL